MMFRRALTELQIRLHGLFDRPARTFSRGPRAILAFGAITVALVAWGYWSYQDDDEPEFLERFKGGTLFIAGGGDLPSIVQQRFWELAGGKRAKLVIIPAYDATPTDVARLKNEWKRWPFSEVKVLQARQREQAEQVGFAGPIAQADAVWLSGGDQSWLADLYAETPVEQQLQALLDRGGIVGGTSAGASIMTRVMIQEGRRKAKLNRGLDLLKDSVVDQHFFQRNRPQRLIGAIQEQPHLVGFGVDEGTALVVQVPHGRLGVIGKSYVMACIAEQSSLTTRLEILKPGDRTDLEQLRGLPLAIDDPEALPSL